MGVTIERVDVRVEKVRLTMLFGRVPGAALPTLLRIRTGTAIGDDDPRNGATAAQDSLPCTRRAHLHFWLALRAPNNKAVTSPFT